MYVEIRNAEIQRADSKQQRHASDWFRVFRVPTSRRPDRGVITRSRPRSIIMPSFFAPAAITLAGFLTLHLIYERRHKYKIDDLTEKRLAERRGNLKTHTNEH